ncbi:glutathione S-transferase Mu 1-like [Centruroides sculpturatus]|uniref:glutathione S-transferase Mu 1-like n=1 Tax=Centruroides sculpturatus TaxID=218467 RepID=UPI000C6CD8FE|nr:glutathione S-transferase Mu 1-like [Centruroides sculpturatus]
MAPVLGYWNIRGLAQPIRLLLAYTETEFEDKTYSYGPPPTFDRSAWLNEKFTLGLDFPNLPYYIDGSVKLTQSSAIMHYLARKNKLDGATEEEKIRIDLAEQQLIDFRMAFVQLCYNPNFETLKCDYLTSLPDKLKLFSNFLGKNKWFAGNNLSHADFIIYEMLAQHKLFAPDCLKEFSNLEEFVTRFEDLPTIKKYMKSDRFLKWPLNGDMAKFGSRSTSPPK